MPLADLDLPVRLLAGGGPSSPHPRALRALGLPVIGQFDPAFTAIMDDVMQLARQTFLTSNERCFAVSGLTAAGLEAVLNSVIEDGDQVAIAGGPRYTSHAAEIALGCGAEVVPIQSSPKLVVAPMFDPVSGKLTEIEELARAGHARGAILVVDATFGLGNVNYAANVPVRCEPLAAIVSLKNSPAGRRDEGRQIRRLRRLRHHVFQHQFSWLGPIGNVDKVFV